MTELRYNQQQQNALVVLSLGKCVQQSLANPTSLKIVHDEQSTTYCPNVVTFLRSLNLRHPISFLVFDMCYGYHSYFGQGTRSLVVMLKLLTECALALMDENLKLTEIFRVFNAAIAECQRYCHSNLSQPIWQFTLNSQTPIPLGNLRSEISRVDALLAKLRCSSSVNLSPRENTQPSASKLFFSRHQTTLSLTGSRTVSAIPLGSVSFTPVEERANRDESNHDDDENNTNNGSRDDDLDTDEFSWFFDDHEHISSTNQPQQTKPVTNPSPQKLEEASCEKYQSSRLDLVTLSKTLAHGQFEAMKLVVDVLHDVPVDKVEFWQATTNPPDFLLITSARPSPRGRSLVQPGLVFEISKAQLPLLHRKEGKVRVVAIEGAITSVFRHVGGHKKICSQLLPCLFPRVCLA
eukprot:m.181428 g.181428  ORF g.181428 m.181428 type:complete len:407 (+) comp25454_c1_seq3:16-1236(+)